MRQEPWELPVYFSHEGAGKNECWVPMCPDGLWNLPLPPPFASFKFKCSIGVLVLAFCPARLAGWLAGCTFFFSLLFAVLWFHPSPLLFWGGGKGILFICLASSHVCTRLTCAFGSVCACVYTLSQKMAKKVFKNPTFALIYAKRKSVIAIFLFILWTHSFFPFRSAMYGNHSRWLRGGIKDATSKMLRNSARCAGSLEFGCHGVLPLFQTEGKAATRFGSGR